VLLALLGLGVATPGLPAQPSAAANLPDTPVGNATRKLLAVLQQGHAERDALVRSEFTNGSLAETPAEEWIRYLDRLADQSGGLDVIGIEPDSTPTFLVMHVRAKKVDRFGRLLVAVARRTQPGKIADVFYLQARDPAKVAADAWPAGKVPVEAVAAEIDKRLQRLDDEDLFSGVVLVARRDEVLYHKAFNRADASTKTLNRLDTRFNLGSMDKMFTGVAVGQLVEQGKLSLDDTAAKLLPDFPNPHLLDKVTVRHLLTHSSGLGDFFGPRYTEARERLRTHRDYFALIATDSLAFEPGSRFGYSNSGYALLGAIVESAAGKDYFAYVRDRVFVPAQMTQSGSPALDDRLPNRAIGYFHSPLDPMGAEPRMSNENAIAFKGNAAGGGYSTALDLFHFKRALTANRLVGAETVATFTTPRIEIAGFPRPNARYAYGFIVEDCGGKRLVGNGGGGPKSGVSSNLHWFEDGSWTVVVLTNYDPPIGDDFAWSLCEFLARQ
jgi:CubicO group peptidase (beta-lactamase class C family)